MEAQVIQGLLDRGVPLHIAQGIAANMIAESRLDPGVNEVAPLVEGSRGGYGLNQWTGPRRVQYEDFARGRGVPLNDLNAQLDFTIWEGHNTEQPAWDALMRAGNAEEAARLYSDRFLRPGIPHMENRLAHARRLEQQPHTPESFRHNALATFRQGGGEGDNPLAQQFRPQINALNAQDFMRPAGRNSLMPIPGATYG